MRTPPPTHRGVAESPHRLESSENRVSQAAVMKQAFDGQRRQIDQMVAAIQRYLPSRYPVMGGLAISGHCRPCADLGGDFYDATTLPDGRVALCMADVSGHGAVAAILMATSRALLRAALMETKPGEGPAHAMFRLANWLGSEFLPTEFVTMWLGIYDPETEILRFANSAHPHAVIWRHGVYDPEFLPSENTFPLGLAGIEPEMPIEGEIAFHPGDRLFLYTDGWIESESSEGRFLDGPEFIEFLANTAGQPNDHAATLLFTEFDRFLANSRIRDDVSILIVDRLL